MIRDPVGPLAAEAIRRASLKHPADAALREVLKPRTNLSPRDAAEAVRRVFHYFRWFGWLDSRQPLQQQIAQALDLGAQFSRSNQSFSQVDLLTKAIPQWVLNEMDVTSEWVLSLQREPVLWLRARPGEAAHLANQLGDCQCFRVGQFTDALRYSGKQDLFRTTAFQAGIFELQDLSSQAVGLICNPHSREFWWDVCAGEGGKLLHLSALMENKGSVLGTDRAAWRLNRLKRRAARAGVFNYRIRIWDGGPHLPTRTKFDGVLVDAPCSGLGTWQRNPHARWTTSLQDVAELAEVQRQLLGRVATSVKPGGKLIYSVCTLTRRETVEVAAEFDAQFPDFERLSLVSPFSPEGSPCRDLLFLPSQYGGNGMYVAGWRRH